MKEIILRGEYSFEAEIRSMVKGLYSILPPGIYMGEPDAAVIADPTIEELAAEAEKGRLQSPATRIIVMGSIYTRLLAIIIFDNLYIAADTAELASIIMCRNPERKSIRLTRKETLLLSVLEKGMSTSELTGELQISERSVRRIKSHLLDKTGLVSAEQLAVFSSLLHQYSQLFT